MNDVNIVSERLYRSSLYSNATGHGFEWRVVRGDASVTCLTVGDARRVLGMDLSDNDDDAVLVFPDSSAGLEDANRMRDRMNAAAQ